MSTLDTTLPFENELSPEELQELSKVIFESIVQITNSYSKPLKDAFFKSFEKSFAPLLDSRAEIYANLNKSVLESVQKLSSAYVRLTLHDTISNDMADAISSFSRAIQANCKDITINPEVFTPLLVNLQKQLKTIPITDEYVAIPRSDFTDVCDSLNLDSGITNEPSNSKLVFLSSERLRSILFQILLVLIPMLHTQHLHNLDAYRTENELQTQQEFYEKQLDLQRNHYEQRLANQQNYYDQQLQLHLEDSNLLNQVLEILQYFENSMQDSEESPLPPAEIPQQSDDIPQQTGQTSSVLQEVPSDTSDLPESSEPVAPTHTVDELVDTD